MHLSAGKIVDGKKNNLEDFNYDKELVEFISYYSSGEFSKKSVEIIINGDFIDFLAVPFVDYFDDEFWSDQASLEKLKMIISAHQEVFLALKKFTQEKGKKLTYVIGNHDAELALKLVKEYFIKFFDGNIELIDLDINGYRPIPNVLIAHGHQEETANSFDEESIQVDENGREYLIPPWGSYFVTRVINRFKSEHAYVNAVRPIKKFIINGLLYETFQTIRFLLATVYYYFIVRFIFIIKEKDYFRRFLFLLKNEFNVFSESDEKKYSTLLNNDDIKVYIQGHTHHPEISYFDEGKIFINTGTWTNMYQLDYGRQKENEMLTYAKIEYSDSHEPESNLLVWKGINPNPFVCFS